MQEEQPAQPVPDETPNETQSEPAPAVPGQPVQAPDQQPTPDDAPDADEPGDTTLPSELEGEVDHEDAAQPDEVNQAN
jgi:hypothetical protein